MKQCRFPSGSFAKWHSLSVKYSSGLYGIVEQSYSTLMFIVQAEQLGLSLLTVEQVEQQERRQKSLEYH
jgi:hypothetical protein